MPPPLLPCKPFVKWVGGKRSLLETLQKYLPENYDTYHECFIGGGALFFEVQPEKSYISDINLPLIITYQTIRDDLDKLIEQLKTHQEKHSKGKHSKEYYYVARKQFNTTFNTTKDPIEIAGYFIYLNKTGYNGLYRVNKKGGFNVPIGSYENPTILDEDNLRAVSELLQTTEIYHHSFDQTKLKKNCFYYLDPPYHKTYAQYDGSGFLDEDHIKLAEFCSKIDKKNGYFMLSNSDTSLIRDLYKDFNIIEVISKRFVSCKSEQRGKQQELLITNYEPLI